MFLLKFRLLTYLHGDGIVLERTDGWLMSPSAAVLTRVPLHVALELLFSEELGLLLEVSQEDLQAVCQRYSDAGLQCHRIGTTCGFGPEAKV